VQFSNFLFQKNKKTLSNPVFKMFHLISQVDDFILKKWGYLNLDHEEREVRSHHQLESKKGGSFLNKEIFLMMETF